MATAWMVLLSGLIGSAIGLYCGLTIEQAQFDEQRDYWEAAAKLAYLDGTNEGLRVAGVAAQYKAILFSIRKGEKPNPEQLDWAIANIERKLLAR